MESVKRKVNSFQLDHWLQDKKWVPAMQAFAIANTVLILGMMVYQFVNPIIFFTINQIGIDISIIAIGIIWAIIISDPVGLGLLVFGWTIAGIYTKRNYGKDASSILLRASTIPVLFILLSVGVLLMSLSFSSSGGFFLLITIGFVILILMIFSAILTFGGLILSQFIAFKSSYSTGVTVEPDYLVLPVIPQNEKIQFCPFRSNLPGCSYLGYKAPNKPLICDYKSSYLRCRVYAHIYEKMEGQKE